MFVCCDKDWNIWSKQIKLDDKQNLINDWYTENKFKTKTELKKNIFVAPRICPFKYWCELHNVWMILRTMFAKGSYHYQEFACSLSEFVSRHLTLKANGWKKTASLIVAWLRLCHLHPNVVGKWYWVVLRQRRLNDSIQRIISNFAMI
jgi:hypothetical protein